TRLSYEFRCNPIKELLLRLLGSLLIGRGGLSLLLRSLRLSLLLGSGFLGSLGSLSSLGSGLGLRYLGLFLLSTTASSLGSSFDFLLSGTTTTLRSRLLFSVLGSLASTSG